VEDLKAYIESGVLELYALGELSPDERHEVELMLARYPELKQELEEIEHALAGYSEEYAIEPDESLRNRILESLDTVSTEQVQPVITLTERRHYTFYKYAFAASVALLLLSIGSIISLNSRLKESNSRIAALELSNQKFTNRINYTDRMLNEANEALTVYQRPGEYRLVKLNGTPKTPGASMSVAFNPAKKIVMIDRASLKMPENDDKHQYQLWALVDGKPVDLGVFDAGDSDKGMIKMKSLERAQAFAVTREVRGGSPVPTLEQMVVIGNI